MKGSIRFNNDIIAEVDVDPSAASGSRLTSCKNLIDGQELGAGGGGGDFSIANVTFGKNEDVDSMDMVPILLEDQLTILPFSEAAGEQQVPLYKGMTTFYIFAECDIQVTGDITVDEYQCVTISGDGSIYLDTK